MAGDIEAATDLVSGALLAHAVDGGGGGGAGGHRGHPALCLNCGTRLLGPHCHRCGQSGHVHRTVGAIGHEIAHGVFHFEGKVWRTLPMLVRHPGRLTRRYIDGERARFVAPLALFLFTVFLLFATISWIGGELPGVADATPQAKASNLARLDAIIADNEKQLIAEEAAHPGKPTDQAVSLRSTIASVRTARLAFAAEAGTPIDLHHLHTGWARLDHGIAKAGSNPGLALYKLQSSAYKYSWLLIPLSTPFVALLFVRRRRFGLYDHAVFVTYSLCFMMLLTVALSLAGAARLNAGGWISWVILLVPPAHMYGQLRGTYRIGRFAAAWRTVALLAFAFTVLSGFVTLLLLRGLTG